MDARRVLRAGGWGIASVAALVVAAYLALLAINWRDAPPSADAARLAAMLRDRPAVADSDNGFVHALGLAAPRHADPMALGARRRAWLEGDEAPSDDTGDAGVPGEDVDYRAARPGDVAALSAACAEPAPCVQAAAAHPAAVMQWLASEQWLLDRYRAMLATGVWRESLPHDPLARQAPYQHALEAQRLHLLAVRRLAMDGDTAMVREQLERDLRFWRMVLASSDMLVTRMIAGAAVRRHLQFGHLALRELPPGEVDAAVPPAWRQPLLDSERSLARVFAGEWDYGSGFLELAMASSASGPHGSAWQRVTKRLLRPLYQPQDTLNRSAARMVRLGETSQLPYPALAAALAERARGPQPAALTFQAYNPVGALLDAIGGGHAAYADYIARASDLEGIRRASLLSAMRRAKPAPAGDAGLTSDDAALRDPYTDASFGRDPVSGAVVFVGLEPAPRGRHTFP